MSSLSGNSNTLNVESFADKLRLLMLFSNDELFRNTVRETDPFKFQDAFRLIYLQHCAVNKIGRLFDPFSVRKKIDLIDWKPDRARVFKTLFCYGFPFWVNDDEYASVALKNGLPNIWCNAAELIYKKYHYFSQSGGSTLPTKVESVWSIFEDFFPTPTDQVAIVLLIMLQTGWNKETALAIDKENFLHELTGAFDLSHVLIQSEKNKSQGMDLPYSLSLIHI